MGNGQVSRAQQQLWLTFYSADGLHPVMPDKNAKLELQDEISVNPIFPFVWREIEDNELLIAANGLTHSVVTKNNTAIIKMLEQLNNGEFIIVEQLIKKYTQSDVSTNIISILNSLHRFRAFSKSPSL